MSNARNLADLLVPGEDTLQTVAIETDRIVLNGTDGSATNAGDDLLLDASAASTDVGERFTYEVATDDASSIQVNQESLVTNQLQGLTDSGSITVRSEGGAVFTNLQQGLAKAGVSVQGVDTFGINQSFNISSANDEGTGHHNVVMTNKMSSTNYHPIIATGYANGNPGNTISTCWAETTTNVEFETSSAAGSNQDITEDYIVVFGDLA